MDLENEEAEPAEEVQADDGAAGDEVSDARLVASLEEQISFLRHELDNRTQEIGRLHMNVMQQATALQALPATIEAAHGPTQSPSEETASETSPSVPDAPKTWWRRLFA